MQMGKCDNMQMGYEVCETLKQLIEDNRHADARFYCNLSKKYFTLAELEEELRNGRHNYGRAYWKVDYKF